MLLPDVVAGFIDHSLHWMHDQTLPPFPSLDICGNIMNLGPSTTTSERLVLPFLKRFTESTCITDGFECGTSAQRRQLLEINGGLHARSPTSLDASNEPMDTLDGALHAKTCEIVSLIGKTMIRTHPCSKLGKDWSPVMENGCFNFFSPQNLRRFLLLFWAGWYPNTPIIHKPTFFPESSPPGLVASLAVLGACMSPDTDDCLRAMAWLSPVEEAVFSDRILFEDSLVVLPESVGDESAVWEKLKALQAAYFICIAQNWEGSKESKQRIRKNRYNHIVLIARSFGLNDLSLATLDVMSPTSQNWSKFILLETCIRTGTYIFLLDSAFVLFWRLPPRVMPMELNMGMVCPESCFQADSAAECFIQLCMAARENQNLSRLTVSSAVRLLCSSQVYTLDVFNNLSSFNMFTIVSALCCLVFQYQTTLIEISQMSPAATGLSQWMWVWQRSGIGNALFDSSVEEPPVDNLWRRIGFMKYAPEYYHLAYAMLERWKIQERETRGNLEIWATRAGKGQTIPKCDDREMIHVKALIYDMENMSH
ncbi:hypothetical protein F53441_11992 [Fusarium austroafricanum]|uniref:Xylanolytic transcriptional activator regulatory domain-containing protein n=1 Tax=Fusarium austroafricanum TaxID=2364996 RepID=A0A8H4NQL4_9HYPO|nr:hypothetical protein F53441_11992 [Fusarium austroafricanum]